MKRKYYLLLAAFLAFATFANAQPFSKGTKQVNVGLGVLPGWGVHVSGDYGLIDTWGPGIFTVGAYVGYAQGANETFRNISGYSHDYRENNVAALARATYRYSFTDKFEVYGGAMFGPVFHSYKAGSYKSSGTSFIFTPTLGVRYSLSSSISIYGESNFNWGTNYLNGGIAFQF